jgi:hypothetical protein
MPAGGHEDIGLVVQPRLNVLRSKHIAEEEIKIKDNAAAVEVKPARFYGLF